jgi:hypothetical protein
MSVVKFPNEEATKSEIDKLHSEAFRDLEGPISDCESMAKIAAQMMSNASTMDGELVFAVCNTSRTPLGMMRNSWRCETSAARSSSRPSANPAAIAGSPWSRRRATISVRGRKVARWPPVDPCNHDKEAVIGLLVR